MKLALVRVRGRINVNPKIKRTLELLNLRKPNHCVVIEDTPTYKGMLQRVKDYITWGEINKDILFALFKKRGLVGRQTLSDKYIKDKLNITFDEFVEKFFKNEVSFSDIPEVNKVFRLAPPRKGFKGSKKKHYSVGGVLGYRGTAINELIERMI
jgi:large subunit ribosomal protein L30